MKIQDFLKKKIGVPVWVFVVVFVSIFLLRLLVISEIIVNYNDASGRYIEYSMDCLELRKKVIGFGDNDDEFPPASWLEFSGIVLSKASGYYYWHNE